MTPSLSELYFSKRTNWLLANNELTSTLENLLNEGKPILDLTESNPGECGFTYLNPALVESLNDSKNLAYKPHPQGLTQAREALVKYYSEKGISIDKNDMFLTASTSEAYSYLFRLLFNPEEHVLLPRPSYPLFTYLLDLNDINYDFYSLEYDNNSWHINFDDIEQSITNETKAIILVNPNNPTGSFIKREELEKLNQICASKYITIISDEVFSDFAFTTDASRVSLINNAQALTFVLGGISKMLGLPQMKLSWILTSGPALLVEEAKKRLEIIGDTYLNVNTPVQNSLVQWIPMRSRIQEEISVRIKRNYQFALSAAKEVLSVEMFKSEGGWYLIGRIPSLKSEEDWVLTFLKEDYVFVHPGYFFDFEEESYIVMSLLTPPATFEEGFKRILKRISKEES